MASETEMEKVVEVLRAARAKVREILGATHQTTRERAQEVMHQNEVLRAETKTLLEKIAGLETGNTALSRKVAELREENSKLLLQKDFDHRSIAASTYDDLCEKYDCKGHLSGFIGRCLAERDDLKAKVKELEERSKLNETEKRAAIEWRNLCEKCDKFGTMPYAVVWAYGEIVKMGAKAGNVHSYVRDLKNENESLATRLGEAEATNNRTEFALKEYRSLQDKALQNKCDLHGVVQVYEDICKLLNCHGNVISTVEKLKTRYDDLKAATAAIHKELNA